MFGFEVVDVVESGNPKGFVEFDVYVFYGAVDTTVGVWVSHGLFGYLVCVFANGHPEPQHCGVVAALHGGGNVREWERNETQF